MPRLVLLCVLILPLLPAAGCCDAPPQPARKTTPPTRAEVPSDLAGHWSLELPNDEEYVLHLFDSGIMGFQHVGPQLPISSSCGRWTLANGTAHFTVVAYEEPHAGEGFPLSLAITPSLGTDGTLEFDLGGRSSIWTPINPYGTLPGAKERAAQGEEGWRYQVERAETK